MQLSIYEANVAAIDLGRDTLRRRWCHVDFNQNIDFDQKGLDCLGTFPTSQWRNGSDRLGWNLYSINKMLRIDIMTVLGFDPLFLIFSINIYQSLM